ELLSEHGWARAAGLGWEVSARAYRRGFIECVETGLERPAGEILALLRNRQHLFSMWPYVQRRDYDALEAAFREDCRKHAGDAGVKASDELPFARYREALAAGLRQAAASCAVHGDARSIYLRIRPDLEWGGHFHVSDVPAPEPFKPHDEYSYGGQLA